MRFSQVLGFALLAAVGFIAFGWAWNEAAKFITGKQSSIVGLSPAIAGVETTTPPSPRDRSNPSFAFRIPRGVVVEMPPSVLSEVVPGAMNAQMISTGERLVLLESDEGQRILAERPVNTRSDGSIRHRQHHPTCFPRC